MQDFEVLSWGEGKSHSPEAVKSNPQAVPKEPRNEEQGESWGQWAKRNLASGAVSALKGIESFGKQTPEQAQESVNKIAKMTNTEPIKVDQGKPLSSELGSALGYKEHELQPKHAGESFIQGLIATSPFAAKGLAEGGIRAGANILGRAAAGLGVRAGLEHVGAPESIQGLGQVGTELALGLHNISKAGKPLTLETRGAQTYENARNALSPQERGSFAGVDRFLERTGPDKLKNIEPDLKVRKAAQEIRNTISRNIIKEDGSINIQNAWDIRRALGQQYKDSVQGLRPYIQEARVGLKKVLDDYGPTNPSFFKFKSDADAIKKFQETNGMIKDWLTKGVGTQLKDYLNPKTLIKAGLAEVIDKFESIARIGSTPALRNHYIDLVGSIAKDNKAGALRAAQALTNKYYKKYPSEDEEPEEFEVISLGKP
jgi:hypothetical protein